MDEKVLIVGAGPTGLTAAVELARRGVSVKVVEKHKSGSGLSRAVAILPRTLSLLEPSGTTERLLAEGFQFQSARFYHGAKLVSSLKLEPNKIQYGYGFLLGLAQDRTEAILRDRLKAFGSEVSFGHELTKLDQDGDQITAGFADGSSSTHSYVFGADGIRSTVRRLLDIDFPGFDLDETWSIADVNAKDWPNHDAFTACLMANGAIVVVVPLETDRCRVISDRPDALAELPIPMDVIQIHREGTFQVSVRQVTDYQKGRAFLGGDAAHCHSPVGGRGMNLGIADGAEFARRLAENSLDGYSTHRRNEGAAVIASSERARKLLTSHSKILRGVTVAAMGLGGRIPVLRQRIASELLYA